MRRSSIQYLFLLRNASGKDVRSAWLEGRTFEIIAAKGSAHADAEPAARAHAAIHVEKVPTEIDRKGGVDCPSRSPGA